MATSSRDSRRRRIVDRGSDRLALITGRHQNLPPSSSDSSAPFHSHTASCPPSIYENHTLDPQTDLSFSDQIPVLTQGEDKPYDQLLPKLDPASASVHPDAPQSGRTSHPLLRKCETSSEISSAPTWGVNGGAQPSLPSSTDQNPPISASETEHPVQPLTHALKSITPNQINIAVAATEEIRLYCSLAVAIMVLLSYVGFPILGSGIIKSTILLRPLYLLLLTNVSIVLALILSEKQGGSERVKPGTNNVPPIGGQGVAAQVGNALELGLLMQNIMGAVFMDCSVYAVVVICGLSVVKKLGW